MNIYKIIIPETFSDLEDYYELRYEVLRKPWSQDKNAVRDEWEDQSVHALMRDENNIAIATGRLQINSETEGQIRSMAVKENLRGQQLGTQMLHYIEDIAREKHIKIIILDARDLAVKFYEKNGYKVEGDSYVLFGTIPHFRMSKKL